VGPVPGGFRPWRRCGGLRTAALDFARRCDPPVYLSNAEKEALFLTGYGDVPPWVVQQGLEQALARGTYVPGEEALRLRLANALDLEERLAGQLAEEAEGDEFASNLQQGLLEGIEAFQEGEEATTAEQMTDYMALATDGQMLEPSDLIGGWTDCRPTTEGQGAPEEPAASEGAGAFTAEQIADYLAFSGGYEGHPDDHERMQLLRQLHNAKPTVEGQEAAEDTSVDGWRSPLEIVTEGAEEPEQEPPGEEAAEPAPADPQIEDRDFSSFTKAQLVSFAWDQLGVELKRTDSKDELIAQVQQLVDEASEKVV